MKFISCKSINEVGTEGDEYKCASLDLIPLGIVFEPTQEAFIDKCVEKENPKASYRKGVVRMNCDHQFSEI